MSCPQCGGPGPVQTVIAGRMVPHVIKCCAQCLPVLQAKFAAVNTPIGPPYHISQPMRTVLARYGITEEEIKNAQGC